MHRGGAVAPEFQTRGLRILRFCFAWCWYPVTVPAFLLPLSYRFTAMQILLLFKLYLKDVQSFREITSHKKHRDWLAGTASAARKKRTLQ